MPEQTIGERLALLSGQLQGHIDVQDERWKRVEQAMAAGDSQNSQAIQLLTAAVSRLETNQRQLGQENRERDGQAMQLKELNDAVHAPEVGIEARLRRIEDVVTSVRAIIIATATLGAVGGGGIAVAVIRALGG